MVYGVAHLAKEATTPGQRRTVEATQYAFLRYVGLGGPFWAKRVRACEGETPVMYAWCVATITCCRYICQTWVPNVRVWLGLRKVRTVKARASARAIIETVREHIFHASLTGLDSERSGQKRSKKKPEPKIVATAMPMKMLNEAMPTKSLLWTDAFPWLRIEMPSCWST